MLFLFIGAFTASLVSTIVSTQWAIGYAVFLLGIDFLIMQHHLVQASTAKLVAMAVCLNIGLITLALAYSFLHGYPGLTADLKDIFVGTNRLLPKFFNERLVLAICADTAFKTVLATIFLRKQLTLHLLLNVAFSFFIALSLPVLAIHILRNYFGVQLF